MKDLEDLVPQQKHKKPQKLDKMIIESTPQEELTQKQQNPQFDDSETSQKLTSSTSSKMDEEKNEDNGGTQKMDEKNSQQEENDDMKLVGKPPEHCPGVKSEKAGNEQVCEGCPNQTICQSGVTRQEDPDIPKIQSRMSFIKHKILVLSGKGGVGKSTVSSQLSLCLSNIWGKEVGLLDVDICGPSIPKIVGCEGERIHTSIKGWQPIYVGNLAVMSIAFLLDKPDDAVIWRGPKKNGIIKQFLKDVDWGELDYLIIDTPPGTSDEHISIAQFLKNCDVDGAIVVTTPQEVSLLDVRKEINFCKKVGIPILGVIENMSTFVCPNCRKESKIFPPTTGGAIKMCEEMSIPFLGSVPLDPLIAKACDEGESYVEKYPESPASKAYTTIITNLIKKIEKEDQIENN